jgi:hypothetical protein
MEPVHGLMKKSRVGRFSAIEVGIAIMLLAVVLVGVQGLAARPLEAYADTPARPTVLDLVDDRIERIRTDPMFEQIPARYSGTESTIEGWPGFVRDTRIAARRDSTGAGVMDWLTVTVTVRGPSGQGVVSRTVTIGTR